MRFKKERLIELRNNLGLNKAQAAKLINVSAMAYGRYESGEREPSYQTIVCMAQAFDTSIEYLYGETNDSVSTTLFISKDTSPDLFMLVNNLINDSNSTKRLLSYYQQISSEKN